MLEYKQSQNARVPVKIVDSSGVPVSGVLIGSLTVTVVKGNGTASTITPSAWSEVSTGAFSGEGVYVMTISSSDMGVTGLLMYCVSDGTNEKYHGVVKVVANEEVDTYARLGAPAGASVSADIASANSAITTMANNVLTIKKYQEGRWKIHTTGADANKMVIYDTDGVTELIKFDLLDADENPTAISPFERAPV